MADFIQKNYYGIALDPVHIGTGGYRLGRVDNTIVREPGTNLPKIPGSSICGVSRAYTAMQNGKYQYKDKNNKQKSCAGKGDDHGEGHCGEPNCPVCVTYGFSKGSDSNSFQGMAQFSDARILFFPVATMYGPVWITCPGILNEFKPTTPIVDPETDQKEPAVKRIGATNFLTGKTSINLGWLLLQFVDANGLALPNFKQTGSSNWSIPQEIQNRLILVPDSLFSRLVNDNLEVRTSVAIDPKTGAAEDGALYTYEAIPRATVFWCTATYLDPKNFEIKGKGKPALASNAADQQQEVVKAAEQGIAYIEHLGLGGMNTRGMGRIRFTIA